MPMISCASSTMHTWGALSLPGYRSAATFYLSSGDVFAIALRDWRVEHIFLLVPAQQYVGRFIGTFREFPPSQKGGTFSLDAALQSMQSVAKND